MVQFRNSWQIGSVLLLLLDIRTLRSFFYNSTTLSLKMTVETVVDEFSGMVSRSALSREGVEPAI